jgi:DNA-directed RNA polymerase specialized sigma24 family protein
MGTAKSKSQGRSAQSTDHLLESYYSQFLQWGSQLTRGDEAMARDIVHDLCLHFALAKPDLREVENLDGYLYTCLRHIYLSSLARAARDAAYSISVAEYDSIHFALRSGSPDRLLQRQNDLRRICSYAVWRKEAAKSASYLTLLFFHGYMRSEIAAIACVPLAAIYNKLKIAREELKDYLAHAKTLSVASRGGPRDPGLRVTPVPFAELFDELQTRILESKTTECLPEEMLLEHYRPTPAKPISCSLLAHIVSCERCLALLDRRIDPPVLADREPREANANGSQSGGDGYRALMRSVRWYRNQVYEHRPGILLITVDGKIAASHDVQGERSTLCARIENPRSANFVEVFSEQQVRLALLPVGERPPDGRHAQTQRIALSDDRWLELRLTFDGLGLHSEVTYTDPALATATWDEETEGATNSDSLPSLPASKATIAPSWRGRIGLVLRTMLRPPALAWSAIILIALIIGGFSSYYWRASSSDPNELLKRSVRVEATDLNGLAEHQLLHVEETAADGRVLFQGSVDVWKDGAGRRMRRLYDENKHLIAEDWHAAEGRSGSNLIPQDESLPDPERVFAASSLWREEVSASAFQAIAGRGLTLRRVDGNYEITSSVLNHDLHLTSATLVLNGRLHTVGEILQFRDGSSQNTVRFVQTAYERRPVASTPAGVFDPSGLDGRSRLEPSSPLRSRSLEALNPASDLRLVELHIAVLGELNKLGADVGEPLEVRRTSEGRIRISGTVQDAARRRAILAAFDELTDRRLLDVSVFSGEEIPVTRSTGAMRTPESARVYDVDNDRAPADALIRKHFSQMGMSSDRVDTLAAQFSRDALVHGQRAVQEAYALDRLGREFSASELREIDAVAQHQWAGMAATHAMALSRELRDLHLQIMDLAPDGAIDSPTGDFAAQVQNAGQFGRAVHALLIETQLLNQRIGLAFASGSGNRPKMDGASLIREAARSIPLHEANNMTAFTARLVGDGTSRMFAAKQPHRRNAPQ